MKTLIFLGLFSTLSMAMAESPFVSETATGMKEEFRDLKVTKMMRGGQDGNGGDAVIHGHHRVSLLDLMEPGSKLLILDEEPYVEAVREKMRFFVFQTGLPPAARELTWLLTSQDLENVQDEGIIRYQGPGELKQIAIQKDDVIVINQKLFSKLRQQGKAALIIHEMVISALLEAGYNLNSSVGTGPVREIVNLLFAENFLGAPSGYYKKVLRKLPLLENSSAVRGFNIAVAKRSFDVNYANHFTITEPRILIGNKYFKISSESPAIYICSHFGFKNAFDSHYHIETTPSLNEELAIQTHDDGPQGQKTVLLKKGERYIKEMICAY